MVFNILLNFIILSLYIDEDDRIDRICHLGTVSCEKEKKKLKKSRFPDLIQLLNCSAK